MVDLRKKASGAATSSVRIQTHLIALHHEGLHDVRSHELKVRMTTAEQEHL